MDHSNPSVPPENETTPDSENTSSATQSTDAFEANDSTSNSFDFDAEKNESTTNLKATSLEAAQGLISEAVSSDITDENIKDEASQSPTPVLVNAENSTAVESLEDEKVPSDNGSEQPTKDKTLNESEESTSNPKSEDISDTNQAPETDINNSNDEATIDNDETSTRYNQYENADESDSPYYIKWIMWKGVKTPIVLQNDNGPCPLLAIINILLLKRAISFPNMQEMITTQQLMEYLGDVVLKEIPENMVEGVKQNFEQNMSDALSILPKLKTGLDVNVKFTGVGDFEFTQECVIFDLLSIHLYHGWLVDPQNTEYKAAIGSQSYNQLVETIVASKENNGDAKSASDGLFAESFLQETANQLTHHGVCELNAKLDEDELCVFFRNNHFSTLYKHKGELFVLLTDQGFLTEEKIVWQALSSVNGDGVFVDCDFKSLPMRNEPTVSRPPAITQEDQDYMLALSIQKEQQQQAQQQQPTAQPQAQPVGRQESQPTIQEPEQSQSTDVMSQQELFDLQYAMQLQEEEESRARAGQRQQQQQQQRQIQERRATRRQTPPPSAANMQENTPQRQGLLQGCIIL